MARMPFMPKVTHLKNGIYCFNYHRVGDKASTKLDENLFSCTSHDFDMQLKYFKEHFELIDMEQLEAIKSLNVLDKRYLLLTFDDGYSDNYYNAYPLLKKHGLTATFFITTDYIDRKNNIVPWWDEVAYLVKATHNQFINLTFGNVRRIAVDNRNDAVRAVLRAFKDNNDLTMAAKVSLLKSDVGSGECLEVESEFMTWEQIKTMSENGMVIGSHTCSHQILSHLPFHAIRSEVELSQDIIEQKIGKRVELFAYPVGNNNSYDESVINILKTSGYKYAFTFEKGLNNNSTNAFEMNRYPVNYGNTASDLVKLAYINQ